MANKTITLKSGAELTLQCADLDKATALYEIIAAELQGVDIKLQVGQIAEAMTRDLGSLAGPFLKLIASKLLKAAIFACAGCCLYNGVKITKSTFESEEARPDWIPVALEVIRHNLSPFFKNLDLSSFIPPSAPSESPR